ncbi:MAG: aminotransferase class III-fold pyridoxal phosphate-dependent enzyme, partial [Pseudomonadota bacterium]
ESGQGAVVKDVDGHEYLNFVGEYTAGLFGHSHPTIRRAIDDALDSGVNLSAHNVNEVKLAAIVCDRFPSIERVRFTNSGTEANLMAISTARYVTGRKKVMVFNGGYHGGLLYFGGGGIPINAPFEFVVADFNQIESTRTLLELHGEDLACVLVEPVLGSGGCIPANDEFLNLLRQETSNHGIRLIFDEVMTSRLSPGGAQQLYGITPDITTLGKYVGGGMSFGAFGADALTMSMYDPTTEHFIPHAGTFNNNSLTMAAGVAAMSDVFTDDVAERLNETGEALRRELNQLLRGFRAPMQFTGKGSLMNLHATGAEINSPNDLVASDDRLKELVFLDLLELGIYIARRGFVSLMLPLEKADYLRLICAMEKVLEARCSLWKDRSDKSAV